MASIEEIAYSREATVRAIADYYDFLTKLYLDESRVLHPPAGGWPSIVNADRDSWSVFGKSEEVLGLLAQLPYVHSAYNYHDDADVAPSCRFANWEAILARSLSVKMANVEELRVLSEGSDLSEFALPHVIGLAYGGRYNPTVVLDTKLGVIHWEDCWFSSDSIVTLDSFRDDVDESYEGNEDEADEKGRENTDGQSCDDGDESDESDQDQQMNGQFQSLDIQHDGDSCSCCCSSDSELLSWRDVARTPEELLWRQNATSWAIPDFFETLKENFRNLEWVPISPQCVVHQDRTNGSMVQMLRDIYRRHGWPDLARYRKSECMDAVYKAMKEHYREEADWRWDEK